MKKNYQISGMTCSGCAQVVRNVLSRVKGVQDVEVSLEDGQASVESEEEVSLAELRQALEKTPYRIGE